MTENRVVVRHIAWRELFPWLLIFRSFRLALSLPVLFLASLGALLTPVGWWIASGVFGQPTATQPTLLTLPAVDFPLFHWDQLSDLHYGEFLEHALRTNVLGVCAVFLQPLTQLFDRHLTVNGLAHATFVGLWNLLVWSLFAGAITRIAVVQLGREERVGLQDAVGFSLRRFGWNLTAPLFPLLGIAACAIPVALLGFLMRWDVGVALSSLTWLLALIGGFAGAVLLYGLVLGGPLMWPTISAEESGDAFEAFSRSYSFTLNRPLNCFFYAALAIGYGLLCWLLVWAMATATVELVYWAASWGAGNARISEIIAPPKDASKSLWVGSALIQAAVLVVRVVATGFNHAFFWCAASAIYLCLRRDVDRTEFDEVFTGDDDTRYQLPSLAAIGDSGNGSDAVASSSTGIGAETPADPSDPNDPKAGIS